MKEVLINQLEKLKLQNLFILINRPLNLCIISVHLPLYDIEYQFQFSEESFFINVQYKGKKYPDIRECFIEELCGLKEMSIYKMENH